MKHILCSWKIPSIGKTSEHVGRDTTTETKQLTIWQMLMLITTGLKQNQN